MAAKESAAAAVAPNPIPGNSFEHKRDAYGFAVRPHHLQRYREYANIYKDEEKERSNRWKVFLERNWEPAQSTVNGLYSDSVSSAESIKSTADDSFKDGGKKLDRVNVENKKASHVTDTDFDQVQIWRDIKPSLHYVEHLMSSRLKRKPNLIKNEPDYGGRKSTLLEEDMPGKVPSKDDSDEEFYDLDRSDLDSDQDATSTIGICPLEMGIDSDSTDLQSLPIFKELECLVQVGLPMALRGELWQAFVGIKARRVENYYQSLLKPDIGMENKSKELEEKNRETNLGPLAVLETWKTQIEKDLPRIFPGHPTLDESRRNALRRILTAYARHNPSVSYCQAMNLFAGMLLLLMPEENAFWTLTGILDDYFDGYYSEEMIEAQVDQLVLDELVRERFPKLVKHLEFLGVQVAWMTGHWFLAVFMNVLPWESVLRVLDMLLFEGNRVMLFRTTLALMELYGPALATTRDAGAAVKLLQSLVDSTFDSSQLVLTACMGFHNIQEKQLQELRNKQRPAVRASMEENVKADRSWKDTRGLNSKLYIFKKDPGSNAIGTDKLEGNLLMDNDVSHLESLLNEDVLYMNLNGNVEIDSDKDIEEQLAWLKAEFCKQLKEKRSAEIRTEELETTLMEMVKQDNRLQLSARVEQLEREISALKQALADKVEQEKVMFEVLKRVEEEQKVTEDARRFAEQDAAAQRYVVQVLQDKYEDAAAAVTEMERRAVMAESMLEATMQSQFEDYQPQSSTQSSKGIQISTIGSLLRWRARSKQQEKPSSDAQISRHEDEETNGH